MHPVLVLAEPVAPLDAVALRTLALQLSLLLAVALCFGLLARRMGLPALAGELLGGVLLGPSVFGNVSPELFRAVFVRDAGQSHLLDAVSQVGIVLLVGLTSARLDTGFLRRRAPDVARIGLGGLLLPFGAGVGLGYLMPAALLPPGVSRGVVALYVGVALGVTAIPVIAKTLSDLGYLYRDVGQLALAAAAVADTVGWLLLAVVAALATVGSGTPALVAGLGIPVILIAAWLLGRPLGRLGQRLGTHTSGAAVAFAVLVTLIYSAGTAWFGLEAVLGAFLAGVTVLRRIEPRYLAGLNTVVIWVFAPIFVAGVGLRIDLTPLAHPVTLVAAVVAVVVALASKLAGVYLGARASRLSRWEALAVGSAMNSRGLVEVIIALVGLRLGLLTPASFTIVIVIALVTSLLAAPMLRFTMRRVPPAAPELARADQQRGWSADGSVPVPTVAPNGPLNREVYADGSRTPDRAVPDQDGRADPGHHPAPT